MEKEQIDFRFEGGELVAPVSQLYKSFVFNMMDIAVHFDDSPLLHQYLTTIMKDAFSYDDLLKKAPKQLQEEIWRLLDVPYEDMYEMVRDEPHPQKLVEPKLRLVK